jgi:hypothetical protein
MSQVVYTTQIYKYKSLQIFIILKKIQIYKKLYDLFLVFMDYNFIFIP